MELELTRIDYAVIGITSRSCMKLLPSSTAGEQQKVAVADSDGILQLFAVKKEDIYILFKTLPGHKISSLQLGGELGTSNDKIFVSSGNEVRGYTNKGKLFLSFDSNMTEPITSMFVLGNDLFLCGKHIYNHYKDCKDIGSYLCGDCIIDVIALETQRTRRLISLIACEGRMIRAIEHARVTVSMEVESSPTVLHIFEGEGIKHVIFGTVDGRIGVLDIERKQSFSKWLVQNNKFTSAISCIDSYHIDGSEYKNLILGRQDGNIEVYNLNCERGAECARIIYNLNCNESVTAVQCGILGTENYVEVLVATYTGRIFGLTTQILEKTVGGDSTSGNYIISADTNSKILKFRNEIEELQKKLLKEREMYRASTASFMDEMSAIPLLTINDAMILNKPDASYIITIEVPTAIDNVLLQSDLAIELLDVEKNSAVVSYSETDPENGNLLLATYRCQINTNRLELKIRTIEGQHGTLQAYVTPFIQPKCCQVRRFEIKPLSMHCRIHTFDESRPCNTLTIKGTFSLAEIHTWIYQCLPEVPEKPQFTDITVICFQSTFLDTQLKCSYKKGEAEFKSDSVSTIAILREFLTKEPTKKKIKIDLNVVVNDSSISHVLKLIDPKLCKHAELSNQIALLEALHELGVNDEETMNSLSPKYKTLLENEKMLRNVYSNQPAYLDRHYGIITNLYVDYYKLKGIPVKSKLPKLVSILENYSYERLLSFFTPELENSST